MSACALPAWMGERFVRDLGCSKSRNRIPPCPLRGARLPLIPRPSRTAIRQQAAPPAIPAQQQGNERVVDLDGKANPKGGSFHGLPRMTGFGGLASGKVVEW